MGQARVLNPSKFDSWAWVRSNMVGISHERQAHFEGYGGLCWW